MTKPPASLVETALAYARSRAPIALVIAFVALVARLVTMPTPPARSVDAIAAMLGAAVGGTVKSEDFVWEERGGLVHDALMGRRVLFLAARANGPGQTPTNDLFRAEVRISRGGRPIAVRRIENLTNTPRGNEHDLVAHDHYAAFATTVDGVEQTITILDLAGDGPSREAKTRSERLRASIESFFETGTTRGIGRTEVSFASPPKEARFELTESQLVLALGPESLPAAVGLSDGSVNPGPRDDHGITAKQLPHIVTPWTRFAVETARHTLGDGYAKDTRRLIARLSGDVVRFGESFGPKPPELKAEQAKETAEEEGFPPPRIATKGAKEMPGEGLWLPASTAFASPDASPDAPPLFFETTVRPDATRPHVIVRLVAMDGRRLELRPLPGTVTPRSETGLHGDGRISAAEAPATVAVFAGGAPEQAGALGVVVEKNPLVFARPDVHTLAIDRFGRTAIGPWPFGAEIPATIRSIRQAGAPLLHEGRLGSFSEPDTWLLERSGLCVTDAGHIVYGWARDIPAETLARALLSAGCREAIPLATSPDPVGLGFFSSSEGQTRSLTPGMSLDPSRVLTGSPFELVSVVLRKSRPDAPLPEGGTWEPDPGKQPPPTWQPALYTAKVTKLGAEVRLMLFAPERFSFRVRAGTKELSHRQGGTFPTELDQAEKDRALVAIGLGVAKRKAARGLAIGGSIGLKFNTGFGALVFDGSSVRIDRSESFVPTPDADATELPLTADEGRPLPEARVVGSMRPRAALGVREDGSVLVATTTFDTDEATTEALVDAGCARVVVLDRGTHSNAFVNRAGTEAPPVNSYEQSVIFAVDAPMRGRSFALKVP